MNFALLALFCTPSVVWVFVAGTVQYLVTSGGYCTACATK